MIRKIGILGPGNLGSFLQKELSGTYDVTIKSSGESIKKLSKCQVLFICVREKDLPAAISEAASLSHTIPIIHFSGLLGLEVFPEDHPSIGILHFPLSITQDSEITLKGKWALAAGNDKGKSLIREIFKPFEMKIVELPGIERSEYHYACTLAANIPFFILDLAHKHFSSLGIPDKVLYQLFQSGWDNYRVSGGEISGPLSRGDHDVIVRHLDSIKDPDESDLYRALLSYFKGREKK